MGDQTWAEANRPFPTAARMARLKSCLNNHPSGPDCLGLCHGIIADCGQIVTSFESTPRIIPSLLLF
jgi:hypothetical protein